MRTPLKMGACLGVAALLSVAPARATIPIVDGETTQFTLAGYVRNLTGYQRLPYDVPEPFFDSSGLNQAVTRFEWGLNIGEHVTFDLDNLFFWTLSSEPLVLEGGAIGVGVSAVPGRSLDLSSTLIDDEQLRLVHDIDRLALLLFFDWGDLTIGRQAITWGHGALFPVADLWSTFSPFELETTDKRGLDAVRFITAPGDNWELELIVADKGSIDHLSGGAKATFYLDFGDLYVAAAKIWNEVMLFAGVQADLDTFSLRSEAVLPYDLDDTKLLLPRITAGLDYLASDWVVSVELTFNGLGAKDTPEGYFDVLTSDALARGETYLLGRYYLGAFADYKVTELFHLSASAITNLVDPSAVFTATATYDVAANADIGLGAIVPAGSHPTFSPDLSARSEFGLYGQLYYLRVSAYW